MGFDVIVMFFVFGLVERVGLEHMSVHADNFALVGMNHLQRERDFGFAKTKHFANQLVTMIAPMCRSVRILLNITPKVFLELPDKFRAVVVQANAAMLELVEQDLLIVPPIHSLDRIVAVDVGLPTRMD